MKKNNKKKTWKKTHRQLKRIKRDAGVWIVQLTPEVDALLTEYSEKTGITKQQAAEKALTYYANLEVDKT